MALKTPPDSLTDDPDRRGRDRVRVRACKAAVASRSEPDGPVSFTTTAFGFSRFECVVRSGAALTLVVRAALDGFDEESP